MSKGGVPAPILGDLFGSAVVPTASVGVSPAESVIPLPQRAAPAP